MTKDGVDYKYNQKTSYITIDGDFEFIDVVKKAMVREMLR